MSSSGNGRPKRKPSRSPCNRFLSLELNYVKKYFKTATIDGIEHVTEGKSVIRRVMWALVLFVSLGVCLYFLFEHGMNFADRPTSTTVRVGRPIEGLPFPAVTVCNMNPVSKSFAEEHGISSFLRFFFGSGSNFFQRNSGRCESIVDNAGLADSTLSFDRLFREGSGSADVFIQSCTFSVNGTSSIDCQGDTTPVLTEFGLCHTFNGFSASELPDTFFQLSGSKYGLRMIVNISQDDYIASLDSDAGIVVTVHDRHSFPDPFEKGVAVGPGNHARIGISSRRIVDKSGKGDCVESTSLHPEFANLRYTTSGCRANARHNYLVNDSNCNCVEFYNPLLENSFDTAERNCTLADACCIAAADFTIESGVNCPPPCDYSSFDQLVSYSKFPFDRDLNEYSEIAGLDVERIEDDLVSFNVYFSDLYVQHSETVISYGPRLLIADIGGTLGLFLGASIVSFLEIIVLFYDEIKACCCVNKKVRKGWDKFELKFVPGSREENRESSTAECEDQESLHKEEKKKEENPSEKSEEQANKTTSV